MPGIGAFDYLTPDKHTAVVVWITVCYFPQIAYVSMVPKIDTEALSNRTF